MTVSKYNSKGSKHPVALQGRPGIRTEDVTFRSSPPGNFLNNLIRMGLIATFLVIIWSVTSDCKQILTLNASNPNVEFKTPTFLRAHRSRAYYSWLVSAPGNVPQLTVSCDIDIIYSSNCHIASFSFNDYDDKISLCGRKHFSKTLNGSTICFEFISSMCFNFNHRGVSCTVSYNPDDIPTSMTPVNPNCTCGEKGRPRIVGGNVTAPNEYPWQALIMDMSSIFSFCGGSVIHKRWVLSASHCMENITAFSILVVLREHDFTSSNSSRKHFTVRQVIMHENYGQQSKFDSDIALLELMKPIAFDNLISPICLPFNYKYYDFTDKIATITGWGLTNPGDRHSISKVLKQINQKIIMPSKCSWLDGYRWKRRYVTENMICALAKNGGAREGDSGGPLLWNSDSSNLNFQVGVFSYFATTTHHIDPNVYARVSQFVDWILAKTGGGNEFCVKI